MKIFLLHFLSFIMAFDPLGFSLFRNEKDMPEQRLYINEVVSSNKLCYLDPYYGVRDWIELYNASEEDISLKGLYISDDLSNGKLYPLPDITVSAGEYRVLLCGKDNEDLLPFSLSRNGEELSLINAHREEICTISVPALVRDVSYARRDDGTYGFCALPTPNGKNTEPILDECPASSALVPEEEEEKAPASYLPLKITSVRTNTKDHFCDSCADWMDTVVLTNFNDVPVDIEGYCLNDKENYVKKGKLPSFILQPNESVMIFCCGENCALKEEHRCIDLGLSKNGDSLYLFDPNKNMIDHAEIPALGKEETYILQGTEWTVEKASQSQLEEMGSEAPGQLPFESSVRINELLYKNKYSVTDSYGDRSDFVELYNASSSPVSLKGWYLSDSEKRLDKWAFPDITLEPGAYLFVYCSGKESTDSELHASFSVGKGETVYLYDSVNNLADSLHAYEVPSNVSIGRENGEYVMYGAPTPGYANGHPWPLESKE